MYWGVTNEQQNLSPAIRHIVAEGRIVTDIVHGIAHAHWNQRRARLATMPNFWLNYWLNFWLNFNLLWFNFWNFLHQDLLQSLCWRYVIVCTLSDLALHERLIIVINLETLLGLKILRKTNFLCPTYIMGKYVTITCYIQTNKPKLNEIAWSLKY